MRNIRIGRPTITPEARALVIEALDAGRVSEGKYTNALEEKLSKLFSGHAIVTSSGHAALMLALRAIRDRHKIRKVVTSPITFVSTASAALEVDLKVIVTDTIQGSFLMDHDQAATILVGNGSDTAFLPVHLFGYPVPVRHGGICVEDACEALGSRFVDEQMVGSVGIGCFSFYTSHVLGAGEMGFVLCSNVDDAQYVRRLKDQGRRHIRPHGHVEARADIPPQERYSHDLLGWNLRTTDLQSALILGNLPTLDAVIARRQKVVLTLNEHLRGCPGITLPAWSHRVSYLGYPIVCHDARIRDLLLNGLDAIGIETRPIMSLLPVEKAVGTYIWSPYGFGNAADIYRRSLYVSCHDTLSLEDITYMAEKIRALCTL